MLTSAVANMLVVQTLTDNQKRPLELRTTEKRRPLVITRDGEQMKRLTHHKIAMIILALTMFIRAETSTMYQTPGMSGPSAQLLIHIHTIRVETGIGNGYSDMIKVLQPHIQNLHRGHRLHLMMRDRTAAIGLKKMRGAGRQAREVTPGPQLTRDREVEKHLVGV